MKIEKKHVIAVGLGLVCTAAGLAYWQYTKLMNYCISLYRVKLNTLTENNANFDLFLNLKNRSSVTINILSQDYSVYLNNSLISKISNPKPQTIAGESTSVISVNIKFNPKSIARILGKNALQILLSPETVAIKVDIKLKVKLWIITVNIPYTYQATLKELMTPSTEPKNDTCK